MSICIQSDPTVRTKSPILAQAIYVGAVALALIGLTLIILRPSSKSEPLTRLQTTAIGFSSEVMVTGVYAKVENGFVTLTGDVRNLTTGTLKNPEVVAEFRSSDGELLSVERALAVETEVRPGAETGFELIAKFPEGAVGYKIQVR